MVAASLMAGVVFPQPALSVEVFSHFGSNASGLFFASTGMGLEPVVSTPIPTRVSGEKPDFFACSIAPRTLFSRP